MFPSVGAHGFVNADGVSDAEYHNGSGRDSPNAQRRVRSRSVRVLWAPQRPMSRIANLQVEVARFICTASRDCDATGGD